MSEWVEWRGVPRGDFAVIGDPVAHSLSPPMHRAAYASLGLPYSYVAVRVPLQEVTDALDRLRDLGYLGANVTVQLKEAVIPWLAEVTDLARRARSVNTIDLRGRRGTNTDAPGFLLTLKRLGLFSPARVLLLGAGGSARSLALALAESGYQLSVFNRTRENAERMVAGLNVPVLQYPDIRNADLIVNATSASLTGENLSLDWSVAPPNAIAYDLMYADGPTQFLAEADAAGLKTVDGRPLLAAQGELSFEWWLGRKPPAGVMLNAIS